MSSDEDLVGKGHREREKQRYNSKGEGLWLATTLSKSYPSLASRWLSMRRCKNWYQGWAEDSCDVIDQILIQVLWQRRRICYNSRHIKVIVSYLQTSWLQIPLTGDFLDLPIWLSMAIVEMPGLFNLGGVAFLPSTKCHESLEYGWAEKALKAVLGRMKVYNRRVVRWEHKDRDPSTKRKSMTQNLSWAGSGWYVEKLGNIWVCNATEK